MIHSLLAYDLTDCLIDVFIDGQKYENLVHSSSRTSLRKFDIIKTSIFCNFYLFCYNFIYFDLLFNTITFFLLCSINFECFEVYRKYNLFNKGAERGNECNEKTKIINKQKFEISDLKCLLSWALHILCMCD